MVNIPDDHWKKSLTKEQYAVLRQKATEAPFSGDLLYNEEEGKYLCAGCGAYIFASQHKFESGCGWPSFYNVASNDAVKLKQDLSQNMNRVEILCANCEGHLGHVFNDAPDQPTGLRFCVNSLALKFKADA